MADERTGLPDRITPDAIVEALVEFRIEHGELPEAVLGRLLDVGQWNGFSQTRLPTADIPQSIKDMDVNLRYQPSIELRNPDNTRIAKVGAHVVSYHVAGSYPGWTVFKGELESALREIIEKLKSAQFSRIGFRYVNLLRPDRHFVNGMIDTNIVIRLGDRVLAESVNVNYTRRVDDNHVVTVKIATPDLVVGSVLPGYSLLLDIDVGSVAGKSISGFDDAMAWIERAHDSEKAEFFGLLPTRIIERLQSEVGASSHE
jgi:uncharacterized protein (TIGR04255 family)